jgi:beta-lactamase class A
LSPAIWSVQVQDVESGEVLFERQPGKVLATASVGKILLLVHVAELVRDGRLDPAEGLTRTPRQTVADSGIWQYLATDTLPVHDLCELVGMASDNLATNVLLARVGLDQVASSARRMGLHDTALHDRVRDVRTTDHPVTLSTGSAAELGDLMVRLHRGARADEPVGTMVLGWLAKGLDLSQVASGWGLDPLSHLVADRGLRLVNKTGTDTGVRADVGILTGPAASIAYAVVANWDASGADDRDAVLARQREIGLVVAELARGERPDERRLGEW